MREIFKSGSVGRAPGNRCLYLELDKFFAGAPNFPVIVGVNQDISNIFKESASLQNLCYP